MNTPATDRPSPFPWPPVLLVSAIVVAMVANRWIWPLVTPLSGWSGATLSGWVLLAAGAGLSIWAAVQFFRFRTSIRPDRGADALLMTGPFAVSRNPIYLGEVIGLVGAGLAFDNLWLILVVPAFAFAVTRLAILREEAYLQRRFGPAFADYCGRVRRWI
jgi:protein-S-isoprenylcysteine O-methyltransferase Ste14